MNISSRTPEGRPNRCPTCGKEVQLEPSADTFDLADAPCPHCGCLIWFAGRAPAETRDAVDETKTLINDWVHRFAELSRTATDPAKYLQEMLSGLVRVLAAHGGAIWTRNALGLQMQCDIGIGSRMISQSSMHEPAHVALLERAFLQGDSLVLPPNGTDQSGAENGNTTGLLLLLSPVLRGTQTVALIEIVQRVGASINVQRGYLRFLQQMCELAEVSPVIADGTFGL